MDRQAFYEWLESFLEDNKYALKFIDIAELEDVLLDAYIVGFEAGDDYGFERGLACGDES